MVWVTILYQFVIRARNLRQQFLCLCEPPCQYRQSSICIHQRSNSNINFIRLYSKHIVIPFIMSMMVATYDYNGQNGNIFFLVNDATYTLSLVNMKTTIDAPSGSLQYLKDHTSYIIQLNIDSNAKTFYIVWSDIQDFRNFTFLNSLGDNKNDQIMTDFSNQLKMSSFVSIISSTTSLLYLYIFEYSNVIKYVLTVQLDGSFNVVSIAINKEFSVEILDNLTVNKFASTFQVSTKLKCMCQVAQFTEMICFYGTDACTFTVQTLPTFCIPN